MIRSCGTLASEDWVESWAPSWMMSVWRIGVDDLEELQAIVMRAWRGRERRHPGEPALHFREAAGVLGTDPDAVRRQR